MNKEEELEVVERILRKINSKNITGWISGEMDISFDKIEFFYLKKHFLEVASKLVPSY